MLIMKFQQAYTIAQVQGNLTIYKDMVKFELSLRFITSQIKEH